MIKAYRLLTPINNGKIKKVEAVIAEYRKLAKLISDKQWKLYYQTGRFNKNLDIKDIVTPLSERYKQTCQYQVVGMLESFISNRKNDCRDTIYNSSCSPELKKELFTINKIGAYNHKKLTAKSLEAIKIVRDIYRNMRGIHSKPSMLHINMALDSKVAEIQISKDSSFDYWVRLSTLEKGKPVLLPVKSNDYFSSAEGMVKNFVQLNVRDKHISLAFLKESADYSTLGEVEKASKYSPKADKIGLDLGLNNLFGSDKGDLFGRGFKEVILQMDSHISNIARNRQKQGLKTRSPRYDKAVDRLRQYLKNEINRVINRAVELHSPKEIVIEKLNFKSPKLTRRMNRLLSNFGKNIINAKFERLKEEYGIIVTEVNPAYTSQECSVCGYVDKNNRKTQKEFLCLCCLRKSCADINAPRVLVQRRSLDISSVYMKKETVLRGVVTRFTERSFTRGSISHYSLANLLDSNPYFKGWRQEETNLKKLVG